MNCKQFESLLADALGNELSADSRVEFDIHLMECPKCREDYESSIEVITMMEKLPAPGTSPRSRATTMKILSIRSILRIAAIALFSFLVGYGTGVSSDSNDSRMSTISQPAHNSVESAIVDNIKNHPDRTLLANTLSAVLRKPAADETTD